MRSSLSVRRSLALVTLVFLILAAGCTEETINNVYTDDGDVTYTLTGRVLAYPGNVPVAAATYTVLGLGITGTTDEEGLFDVAGMSPGTYQVEVSAEGYATSLVPLALGFQQYKSNINQMRTFYLVETASELRLTIRGEETGNVLEGVTVEVLGAEISQDPYGHQIDRSSLPAPAVTDENGQVTFRDMPSTNVYVAAQAYDEDGDGTPDYGTMAKGFNLTARESADGNLVMETYTGDRPLIIATNMPEGYSGYHLVSPSLYFVFSVPMDSDPGSFSAVLSQDNSPYEVIPLATTWTSPIRVELTPMESLDDPNRDYDFRMTANSETGQPVSVSRTFYWMTGEGGGGGTCADVVTDLVATNPVGGNFSFDSTSALLTWNAVPCAGGYRIYARDDRNNPNWVHLQDEPSDYETGVISTAVFLPESFDRYFVDGLQTPLAGTEVTFSVVPLLAEDTGPGQPHSEALIRDETLPLLAGMRQIGGGDNTGAESSRLEFHVLFSEYLQDGAATPTLEISEAGGDPAFTLDPADAVWTWHGGQYSGRFSFEVPAGTDASGDQVRITVKNLTDLSGNLNDTPQTTDWVTIEAWGSQFDFESSPQGWTRTGDGWAWGSPTIGPMGGYESQNCWGLSLNAYYGPNWTTDLYSGPIVVPSVNPTLTFWCWYQTDTYDDYVRLYVIDGTNEEQLEAMHGYSDGWVQKTYNLSGYEGRIINLRFGFTSNSYSENTGFFLDNVVIGEL